MFTSLFCVLYNCVLFVILYVERRYFFQSIIFLYLVLSAITLSVVCNTACDIKAILYKELTTSIRLSYLSHTRLNII